MLAMAEHAQTKTEEMEHPDPSSLHLRFHPDPCLRARALPVGAVTEPVRALAERMLVVMRSSEGIGLAAPQVGVARRMFVCRVPADPHDGVGVDGIVFDTGDRALVCIDPVLSFGGVLEADEEGCLSLPEIRGVVNRPSEVVLEATGLDGKRFSIRAGGLLARCVQHEVDHLDGVLIIDKFGQLDRLRTRSALRRLERTGG